ncbi:MAG: T9SS type A sorting domain-containing protein, partial [Aureispira sp.]
SNTGTDVQTACDTYTWIDGNTYTASNNSATFTLTNTAGCDSIVTLDLIINTVDTTTQTSGNTITANAVGALYQWLACDSNNIAIAGATSATFNPTTDGNYAVVITENGCTDTSACVAFVGTSVAQIQVSSLKVAVYPNPTSGAFTLDVGELEEAVLRVFAANGQLVQQQTLQGNGVHQLELEGAAGIYFLQIQVKSQIQYRKLIKE